MAHLETEASNLLTDRASFNERRFSYVLLATLGIASLVAVPFRHTAFPAPAFIPAFSATTGTADALAAVLLFTLFRVDGSRTLLATAAAYLINALLIVPYAMSFPSVPGLRPFIGNEQSAAWLWITWHATFALIVTLGRYEAGRILAAEVRGRLTALSIAGALVFAGIATAAVTAGSRFLPRLLMHGTFSSLFAALAFGIAAANVAVIALLLWQGRRGLPIFSVWLIVALAAAALDTALNSSAAVRYSAAWYVGKIDTFISASCILVSLLASWSVLYARVNLLAQRLSRTLADGRVLEERLTREHEIAAALQRASLPSGLPVVAGITLHATYRPAASDLKIGGDWYDAFLLPDGRLALTIGDVAGHGLAAAVVMSKLRQALRLAAQLMPDPALMLSIADTALRSEHPDTIATAWVGVLDVAAGTLSWACAGHPAPMLRRSDGSIEELDRPAPPLGIYHGAGDTPPTSTTVLEPQTLLAAYTDGLIESEKDVVAGLARLRAVLAEPRFACDPYPAAALYEQIVTDPGRDDVAVITLAFAGNAWMLAPAGAAVPAGARIRRRTL